MSNCHLCLIYSLRGDSDGFVEFGVARCLDTRQGSKYTRHRYSLDKAEEQGSVFNNSPWSDIPSTMSLSDCMEIIRNPLVENTILDELVCRFDNPCLAVSLGDFLAYAAGIHLRCIQTQ